MRPGDGVVWLTGASQGIGRAVVLELAGRGYRVAASARGREGLESLVAEAPSNGEIRAYPVDVADGAAMAETVARIEAEMGPLGAALLNAGTHRPIGAADFDRQAVMDLFAVNVGGVVNGVDAVIARLMERRAGTLAIVSSVAGYRGLPTAVGYGATKAALINMAESLKLELDPHGVRVCLVCPGFVRTPLTDRNPFPMPFLMEPDAAARRFVDGLEGGGFEITFPRRFTWLLKFGRILPYRLYFALAGRARP